MRHRQPNTHVIQETYRRAAMLGLDLEAESDLALFHFFKHELELIGRGEKVRLPGSARRRLGKLGLIARPGTSLTQKGHQVLEELEAEDVT